jgi:hypothetical protein
MRPGFVSTRYVPPPGAEPEWFGETVAWVPVLDVTLQLIDGGEFHGTWHGPEPRPDENGVLAMEFAVPGKLAYRRIPVADVVAFTVHTPEPAPAPQPEMGRLRSALELAFILVTLVPRLVFAALTGRIGDGELPPPPVVTDEKPLYVPVSASVVVERDDAELIERARRAIDAAMRRLPGFSDIGFVLPPDTPATVLAVTVVLRAPNGPDRYAAEGAAVDAVMDAFPGESTVPGIGLTEFGLADM